MSRIQEEKDYWDNVSTDPEVDEKYISNIDTGLYLKAIGELNGKVLEIGCGVGRLMRKGFCGIDISEGMLKIARIRKPECEFRETDGRTISYPDNTFDSVYCVLVFQHLPLEAVNGYIRETRRVLKDGGRFVFQFIEGREDEPFSKYHEISDIVLDGFDWSKRKGIIHPQWTWVYCHKKI